MVECSFQSISTKFVQSNEFLKKVAFKPICVLLSVIWAGIASAGTMGGIPDDRPLDFGSVMTLSLGPTWASPGKTQTILLTSENQKTYTAIKDKQTLFEGEFFLGWQRSLNPTFAGQLGIAVAGNSHAKLNGDIWDDGDPDFNNFRYDYKIYHAQVAIKGKLLTTLQSSIIQPYVSASLGVGFNRAHDFNSTPKLFQNVPAPNFGSKTNAAFSYNLGVGVQKSFSTHWSAGVGYEFSDWGRTKLSPGPGQTFSSGPTLAHLYTNGLQFNLSYLA